MSRGWKLGDLVRLLHVTSSTYGPAAVVYGKTNGKVEVWYQTYCEKGECAPRMEVVEFKLMRAQWKIVRRKSFVY